MHGNLKKFQNSVIHKYRYHYDEIASFRCNDCEVCEFWNIVMDFLTYYDYTA